MLEKDVKKLGKKARVKKIEYVVFYLCGVWSQKVQSTLKPSKIGYRASKKSFM